jgi:hypothetical protein
MALGANCCYRDGSFAAFKKQATSPWNDLLSLGSKLVAEASSSTSEHGAGGKG